MSIISNTVLRVVLRLTIASAPAPEFPKFIVRMNVIPAAPVLTTGNITSIQIVNILPIDVNLRSEILSAFTDSISDKIPGFFDNDRVLKTLLNFENDRQELLVTWKFDPSDTTNTTIVGKLYEPAPADILVKQKVWVARELSPPIVDKFFVESVGVPPGLIYLRPANKNISVVQYYGTNIENKTLQTLLPSASVAISSSFIQNRDRVLEKYYTTSIEGAELNINYADYRDFIHFGSAAKRLEVFKQKMTQLENYNSVIYSQSLAMSASIQNITGSAAFYTINTYSTQRLELLRSFDGYERFLYYGSGSAYSSSLSTDDTDEINYHADATWPKVSGSNVTVAIATSVSEPLANISPNEGTAQSWYDNQYDIASRYDLSNYHSLYSNIPSYLIDDVNSQEFHTFLHMVGHHFDIIKPYIDQMTQIYSRDSSPEVGLSRDMVWNIAASFGIDLPNQYGITDLTNYSVGLNDTQTKLYRNSSAELWKRFLHNQITLLKSKGTKRALKELLNVYGLNSSIIRIRETETPSPIQSYATQSYEQYTENTYALITSASYIRIPFSSSAPPAQTIQVRFATTGSTGVIYQADNTWGMLLSASNSASANLQIVSGTTVVGQVSNLALGEDSFYSTTLQRYNNTITLDVQQYVGTSQVYATSSVISNANLYSAWGSQSILYLGGSGSAFGPTFTGYIDEARTWTQALSQSVIDGHAKDPSAYYGNNSASAFSSLLVRLSFNIPLNYGSASTTFAWNESPYARQTTDTSWLYLSASGFSNRPSYPYSDKIVSRNVYRLVQSTGGAQYSTNKVVIAPDPTLRTTTINGAQVPILSRQRSIVSLTDKKNYRVPQNKIGVYISVADAINDSIYRAFGNIDVRGALGDPSALYSSSYADLDAYARVFIMNYAYTYDFNKLQRVIRNLLGPFFKQVAAFVPAKTKLITGIVVEPHVLYRNRIKTRPMHVEGYNIRNGDGTLNRTAVVSESVAPTTNGYNLQQSVRYSTTGSRTVVGTSLEQTARYNVATIYSAAASSKYYSSVINESRNYVTQSSKIDYLASIDVGDVLERLYKFSGTDPNTRWITYPVEAYTDFDNVSSYEYFYNTGGVYPVIEYRKIRQNGASLNYRGTWTAGTTYTRNDVVLQSNISGAGADGNTLEFRCLTSQIAATVGSSTSSIVNFVSTVPPFLDTNNWVPVSYVSAPFLTIKKIVEISGSISIVPTGSSLPPYVGYHPDHYRFTRDNSTATRRRNYDGCQQTISTTLDGKSPVEIMQAPGDKLFAINTSAPVQQSQDISGPKLDVR